MQLKSKTYLFKGFTARQIEMTNLYYLVLNNILDEDIIHVEQRFKTMGEFRFVELLNLKIFHNYKNIFQWKHFQL